MKQAAGWLRALRADKQGMRLHGMHALPPREQLGRVTPMQHALQHAAAQPGQRRAGEHETEAEQVELALAQRCERDAAAH